MSIGGCRTKLACTSSLASQAHPLTAARPCSARFRPLPWAPRQCPTCSFLSFHGTSLLTKSRIRLFLPRGRRFVSTAVHYLQRARLLLPFVRRAGVGLLPWSGASFSLTSGRRASKVRRSLRLEPRHRRSESSDPRRRSPDRGLGRSLRSLAAPCAGAGLLPSG